jgi:NAD/NADP transhydrogenase beta subunit
MIEILNNEYLSAVIILVSQICFLYLRTLNVIYTAEKKMLGSIITNNGIGIAWLVTLSIGTNSIMNGQLIPIICFLVGGSIGTYLGIMQEKKKNS